MKPYQERVVVERDELAGKVKRLTAFVNGDLFADVPDDERERLSKQLVVMQQYLAILNERIAAFVV